MSGRRVGIYSGTFDPVHSGHIALAKKALTEGEVAEVVFLPERLPRGKSTSASYDDRVAMLEASIAGVKAFSLLTLEDGQFTISDTLSRLQEKYGDYISLIMGSDIFVSMSSSAWPGLRDLSLAVEFVVGLRPPMSREFVHEAALQLEELSGIKIRYHLITTELPQVSSTDVRGGESLQNIPKEVLEYIEQRQLYR